MLLPGPDYLRYKLNVMKSYRRILGLNLIWATFAFGGQTVEKEVALQALTSKGGFAPIFQNLIELAPTGEGTRLGKNFGPLSGQAVGPYEFLAHYAAGPPALLTLKVTLETEWEIVGEDGKSYGQELPSDAGDALAILESVTAVRIESNRISADMIKPVVPSKGETGEDMKNTEEKEAEPKTAGGVEAVPGGGYGGKLEKGDRMYAGEYFSDEFSVGLAEGDQVKVVFKSLGFAPVLLTKQDGRYSGSAGRFDGELAGETAIVEWTAKKNSRFLATITTAGKGEEGTYQASFFVNGVKLPDPAGPDSGDKTIPVN